MLLGTALQNNALTFVLREAFLKNNAALLDSSWHSCIIPVGEVILVKGLVGPVSAAFLSLQNHGIALQAWPIQRTDEAIHMHTDKAHAEVLWKSFPSWNDIWVLPTKSGSPLHALVLEHTKPQVKVGVQHLIAGPAIHVLYWQAQHGFVGILEKDLTKIKKEVGPKDVFQAQEEIEIEDYWWRKYANEDKEWWE